MASRPPARRTVTTPTPSRLSFRARNVDYLPTKGFDSDRYTELAVPAQPRDVPWDKPWTRSSETVMVALPPDFELPDDKLLQNVWLAFYFEHAVIYRDGMIARLLDGDEYARDRTFARDRNERKLGRRPDLETGCFLLRPGASGVVYKTGDEGSSGDGFRAGKWFFEWQDLERLPDKRFDEEAITALYQAAVAMAERYRRTRPQRADTATSSSSSDGDASSVEASSLDECDNVGH